LWPACEETAMSVPKTKEAEIRFALVMNRRCSDIVSQDSHGRTCTAVQDKLLSKMRFVVSPCPCEGVKRIVNAPPKRNTAQPRNDPLRNPTLSYRAPLEPGIG